MPNINPPHIRPVRDEELPLLREIERAAGERFREIGMPEVADDEPPALSVLARHQRQGLAWVATDASGTPVGYLLSSFAAGEPHLDQVSVLPANSGQGIGRSLIDRLAERSAARGATVLTLTTFAEVPWNAPYYLRCGFEVMAEEELNGALRAIREREAAQGLDRWPRVCMRRPLRGVQTRPNTSMSSARG
ncbi:GNAT family N-acetyltransferase [Streptomyces orinoci]|uniref:GNAT family N-acetyltransferase n=1 Tax=Streptomyces orinoci TaxID=67339 RepID=A0ABV3JYL8_STRON|nr:GNAT family N-acetyltransferase [Streptomyces orinoci]